MMRSFVIAALLASAPAVASAQEARASLEQRVQRVEDELAIRRVIADYAAFLDRRDYEAYSNLFTPDGEWTKPEGGGQRGRANIRAMLEGVMGPANSPNAENYHLVSNPRIELDGDRATATSRYIFVMRGPRGEPTPALTGIYHDDFVRRDGQWKIARRIAEDIMPTAAEWRAAISAQEGER
ncbi:nuclear transport factor 2 family protein [Aurantiacibacter poecillastricola]|uniref:nuclear transport factor 2 family protein n=1 Tax=Aurantiacibacter poecillastricola TaxID=3064385 RepID=UPI00273EE8D2|nr:nuclear transport factor 2 family protein [Aurantiacibacter sp. 219JJ12-13]MDP5262911.1 nuclear transport factor 2 family protein [Aurantiacibacter sp. 219JJ12-13]